MKTKEDLYKELEKLLKENEIPYQHKDTIRLAVRLCEEYEILGAYSDILRELRDVIQWSRDE